MGSEGMTGKAKAITLEGLRKSHGDVEILKGIDLAIAPGEFLVLVGPSGCGKSTILRCIAGLEEITAGTLRLGDEVANDLAPADRDLAMVFQSYALYPHMTVEENLGFSLSVRKVAPEVLADRVAEVAGRLDLGALLKRFPKELSGGQRQRVAVGRAIVREPAAFLFDEPLSNLDAELRTRLRVELKELHRELGTTMIYVTHDQLEAMTLADRIAVVRDGELQQVGTPEELYRSPANRFVAGFIGSPAMNFVPVEVSGQGAVSGAGVEGAIPGALPGSWELGFRPWIVGDVEGSVRVQGVVTLVEPLGWEVHVHALVGDHAVLVQMAAEKAKGLVHGAPIGFSVLASSAHLFDPVTGAVVRGDAS